MKKWKIWMIYHLPTYLWGALIFWVSSFSEVFPTIKIALADELGHFGEFFVFAFFLARLLKHVKPRLFRRNFIICAIIFATLYGLLDEVHQIFVPKRGFEMMDIFADFFGSVFGTMAYVAVLKRE